MSQPRRRPPVIPYRAVRLQRVVVAVNRRIRSGRQARSLGVALAVTHRLARLSTGILYAGDDCRGSGREHQGDHCCMARMIERSGKTAHRAKQDLAAAGILKLHHAGPHSGGRTLNAGGQVVAAATGYEIDAELLKPKSAPASPKPPTPGQRQAFEAGRRKLEAVRERLARQRAGP